jgi:AraC-like DNA-binding protein
MSGLQINEPQAKKILEKLKKIETQELFLSKNYSLNTIAKKVGSNSTYVSKIINTYLNKSFVEYTNELRINYIVIKLKEDKTYQRFTLTAIAESIGYKSVNSFNKHFKSIVGVTPKQYITFLSKQSVSS